MGPRVDGRCRRKTAFARGAVTLLAAAGLGLTCNTAAGADTPETYSVAAGLPSDLTQLSLDELLKIDVTSVSKRAEPLYEAAAAIYVITGDELRRSGVRSIAEALRMVPGLDVARSNAQTHRISARGFSNAGDKLEVRLDGHSVYTPLTSAVFWDVLGTYLPDIDRIEVIRGPGATLWGANAVNGVINIVTKSSRDTVGTEIVAGAGNEEREFGAVRSGTRVGDTGHFRLYAQGHELDSSQRNNGTRAIDGKQITRGGFRSDWTPSQTDSLTVSGDLYDGRQPSGFTGDTEMVGSNLLTRWARQLSPTSELSTQLYYDHYSRFIPTVFREDRDTVDLDVQHHLRLGERNDVVYGAGYRNTRDSTGGPPLAIIFLPASRTLQTYSAFAQDQIGFAGNAATLTVGSKFEHNDFTGNEIQPGVRLGWRLADRLFTWGSVARAVRTPNRLNSDVALFCSPLVQAISGCTPGTTLPIGNPNLKSEKLTAYEWGMRYWTERAFSADLALYYNDYSQLLSTETTPPPFGTFGNRTQGRTFGGELSLTWQPLTNVDVRAFYGYLGLAISPESGSTDKFTARNIEDGDPRHQAGLRISTLPAPNWLLNGFLRYVDGRRALHVPDYTELNLRAAYRLWPNLELALVGENLLHASHSEFGSGMSNTSSGVRGNELERSLFAELIWSWQ